MKKDICNKKYICGQMKKITTHILSSNSPCSVDINLWKRVKNMLVAKKNIWCKWKQLLFKFWAEIPLILWILIYVSPWGKMHVEKYIRWQRVKIAARILSSNSPVLWIFYVSEWKKIYAPILSSNSPCFVDINLCKLVEKDACGHKKYMWVNGKNYCSNFEQRFHLFCGGKRRM